MKTDCSGWMLIRTYNYYNPDFKSIRHLPYEERLQQLGLHSLTATIDLITASKIFTGLFDVDSNLFFSPSHSSRS